MVLVDMSKALKTLVIGLLLGGSLSAQEFIAPEQERREIVPVEPVKQRPTIEGIVKEVFTKKPWHAVKPLAPADFGPGEKMVTKDFCPGTP
jgi:hypothetical protein